MRLVSDALIRFAWCVGLKLALIFTGKAIALVRFNRLSFEFIAAIIPANQDIYFAEFKNL